ncbi:MAG TPA: hypothetical protein DIT15_09310 [Arthrobacter bacterium]|jgi:DNA-binding MarR family transcriptional regulator|nr:hypothetical protein [Arthrobacter sp.]HAP89121.1 hypothetical protein [Arthrobacter sp.]HBH58004.1 hypothetical protein [Arthrobacter sp.]HCB59453.1 hypothetical protein [Arthrobacter sp.]HCC39442.1 hypothetical protein [Arthrobacter sp.]
MVRTKKITLGVTAAALALGAGIGVAGMASATTTPTPTPSAGSSTSAGGTPSTAPMDGKGMRGGHGRGGFGLVGDDAAELATKLGVDQAKVTDALKAFRAANKPATPPAEGTKPDPTAMQAELAKSLAASLGIDEAKVTAALDELRTAEQTERAAALKTRLDKAVTDGKLTQAEADAVTKAVQNGVIGAGGR